MSELSGNVVLRPMVAGDLNDVVELLATTSAADIRHRLRVRLTDTNANAIKYVLIAEVNGVVAGAGKITSEPAFPGTVSVAVAVAPSARNHGLGTRLMDRVVARLTEIRGMNTATVALRDDFAAGRRFAERFGFTLANHDIGLRLALDGPAETLAARARETAEEANVRVYVADLISQESTIMAVVARSLPGLLVPFGEDREIDPAATRALISEDAVILLAATTTGPETVCGLTIVTPQTGTDDWYVEFTGVDPDFRGRKVATALKEASHAEAFRRGARGMTTVNDEGNRAIVRLNRKLGMRPSPGYWGMVRALTR